MENRLSELWAIFDFINKGYLGTLGQFQEKYVATIERDEQKDKVKELQRLIQPFLLRRTKRDKEVALNLPDKQEQKLPLTEQASLYEQLIKIFTDIEQLSPLKKRHHPPDAE
jgi:SNF2 family DNA or RNA helicase